ncbi:tRNA 5-methoxyuridine(34)/uridine 5-oxyacetic acid(34) synthase CmoB [Hydrogenovibrio sp. JE_KL2]|uniref:tRNA 5-methoxyuridine(34)/uridine 5-oxyacetic acid(34) synthase CmoB n=1 Tax=Hydrogenovibrio sp. JE_KL2 TaxID=2651188 RepID=UPI001354EBD7|nr:tRNA 5-methoxyuridine(34)/uridine 5-oxyacetic acid(34) synthase CmoB [Hydrogenovibrio sp. JE_KL2]
MKHYFEHYEPLWQELTGSRLEEWKNVLPPLLEEALTPENNGNLPRWQPALEAIFKLPKSDAYTLNTSAISVHSDSTDERIREQLKTHLKDLMPWRKGPFDIEGVFIDTEWHSDWKWDRVQPHLSSLEGKKVLDIGCGSGYHIWRMMGEGARFAVGVDPSLLFMSQFLVLKHFIGDSVPAYFLPLTLEQLPVINKAEEFDTVFSMGVLYHRRSPIDHLLDLRKHMKPGGELVLETLVVPEPYGQLLVPAERYAQMNNVWFLPSVPELMRWMEKCGYKNVRCVDLDQTSIEEQRATEWMEWKSLEDFLDPNDPSLTVEGYPAPLRAVVLANK